MLPVLQRWFDTQHQTLSEGPDRLRAWRQQRRNEALWAAMAPLSTMPRGGTATVERRVQRAILAGADLNAMVPDGHGPASGQAPIGWALHSHRWDLVTWLLEHGADPHALCRPKHPWRFRWFSRLPLSKSQGYQGPIPAFADALLTVAHVMADPIRSAGSSAWVEQERTAMWRAIDAFLDHGAEPERLVAGTTALYQVVMEQPSLAGWDVARLRRLAVNTPDEQGCTVLHLAVVRGECSLAGVQRLLEAGANPHHLDHEGRSPLHRLTDNVCQGHARPHTLLDFLDAWPDLNWGLPGSDGVTPLTQMMRWYGVRSVDLERYRDVLERLEHHQVVLEARLLQETLSATARTTADEVERATEMAVPSRVRARL